MTQLNNTTTLIKSKTKFNAKFSISSICISLMIIILMILILLDPVTYAKSVINGLTLYFQNVLPGLLPFMFFTKLLTNFNIVNKLTHPFKKLSQKVFGVSEYGLYAFFMSIISGYPIGSKITSDLYSQSKITNKELIKVSILSSTPGLIFVIGSVGGLMLKNIKLGIYIYVINIFSVALASFLINIFSIKNNNNPSAPKDNIPLRLNTAQTPATLGALTQDSTLGLLSVGFYIALFTLIIDLLTNMQIFSIIPHALSLSSEKTHVFQGVVSGIVEMTNGTKKLALNLTPLSFAYISSIISFSGISIIMQSLSFLSSTPLKSYKFILGKIMQALICFIVSLIFFYLFF